MCAFCARALVYSAIAGLRTTYSYKEPGVYVCPAGANGSPLNEVDS